MVFAGQGGVIDDNEYLDLLVAVALPVVTKLLLGVRWYRVKLDAEDEETPVMVGFTTVVPERLVLELFEIGYGAGSDDGTGGGDP